MSIPERGGPAAALSVGLAAPSAGSPSEGAFHLGWSSVSHLTGGACCAVPEDEGGRRQTQASQLPPWATETQTETLTEERWRSVEKRRAFVLVVGGSGGI